MRLLKVFYSFCLLMMTFNLFAAEIISSDDLPHETTVLDNQACMQCHEKINSELVKDWQLSLHAIVKPTVDCKSCHGQLHNNMAAKARRDDRCVDCHGGKKDPVVHSYSSSKHGTLMQLEKNSYDWSQPFKLANYRAPGCGYCHMHDNSHEISTTVRHDLMADSETEIVQDKTRAVCQDCHSPRYITQLFSNGEAMLEIARKKIREADALIEQAEKTFSEA